MFRPDSIPLAGFFGALLFTAFSILAAQPISRGIPAPLPGNPGNVFLRGDDVSVPVPGAAAQWQTTDVDGTPAGNGRVTAGQDKVSLGKLGVGWYRIEFRDAAGQQTSWTTAAVLTRLMEPVPEDSPVCTDSATAWFARRYEDQEKHQEILSNLASLAGVNWIRDRMAWAQMETQPGTFAQDTIYDSSATLETKQGIKVLQVFHSTPAWAIDKTLDGQNAWKRFPRDLRHHYSFCRAMARRFRGRVLAWEPWNEANIEPFGGHTIDEMCSLQKAAYLGFKAGDPEVKVCWNVYAGPGSPLHTDGIMANEVWPYFETYNIHSYSKPEQYLPEFATARQGACGRPIWITECGIRLRTENEPPWGDLTSDDERRQAEFIAKSYASSLFAGVDRHFFFILGNYIERGTQFGLLRHDHTPRPGYVALAAVGRFLAGATCLGRVSPTIYAFRAGPDGKEQDVLVAWGEETGWPLPAGLDLAAVYDHIGRPVGPQAPKTLRAVPVFVIMPPGETGKLKLEPRPEHSTWRDGAPSPIVLQVSLPCHTIRLGNQAHQIEPGKETELPLFVYNFGDHTVSGSLACEDTPPGWRVELSGDPVRLEPMAQNQVSARVTMPKGGRELMAGSWIRLRGDFGDAGRTVIAFRLAPDLTRLEPVETRAIAAGDDAGRWEDNIVRRGTMNHCAAEQAGVLFEMQFADTDPWAYPRLRLSGTDFTDDSFDGLALTVQMLKGRGTVRVQFVEECGAAYLAEAGIDSDVRAAQRAIVLFRDCKWGAHSKPDPDGRLQPADIRAILVGINSNHNSQVKMAVSGLAWVKF